MKEVDKLNRYEQYRALQSLEGIASSLSILVGDTKERKIALKKHNELVEGLETSILDIKETLDYLKETGPVGTYLELVVWMYINKKTSQ